MRSFRKTYFTATLMLAASSALPAHAYTFDMRVDTYPGDSKAMGFVNCRAYGDSPRGQIGYWSQIFSTTKTALDIKGRFAVYAKATHGATMVPSCAKWKNRAHAVEWMADDKRAVQTPWAD